MGIEQCRLIHFRKITDARGTPNPEEGEQDVRGNLTPVEGERDIPFAISRVFYVYDVPGGAARAGHANKRSEQVIIAMSGSFDVLVKDGSGSMRYQLNRAYYGLYIPTMIWREIDNFSSGAVCLALASTHYDANDYYRDFPSYKRALHG